MTMATYFKYKIRFTSLLELLLVFQLLFHSCSAIGLSLGQCDDEIFKCQCGPQPGRVVEIPVPRCTFIHRWKPYCHACKNGDRISPNDVCPKYQRCLECATGGGSCSSCPQGKFGTFCEQTRVPSSSGSLLNLNVSLGLLNPLIKTRPTDEGSRPVPECRCINGGTCRGFNDFCTCPQGFQGVYCERKTGCPNITVSPPVSVVRIPENAPLYMEFSCPRTGYLIEGSTRLTCVEDRGQWSHPPPVCVPSCKLPALPVNGSLANLTSEDGLVKSGRSVDFECKKGFVLIGASRTTCMSDTNWSHPTPFCSKVTYCPEPVPVLHATYQLQVPPFQPAFTNGTSLIFTCTGDHLLMGQAHINCGSNGVWSSDGPTCVKVFDSQVNCETAGAEVVDEVGTPVRIHCPPGCSASNSTVLGTVIYEETSSVCRAAVHSGRISNSLGGSLFLVNNGPYNDFLGSTMNAIASERKLALSNSFRFHHDPALEAQNRDDPFKGCPEGWLDITGHCIYVVAKRRAWDVAQGICTNMGSRLPSLRDEAFLKEILRKVGPQADVQRFWLVSKSNTSDLSYPLWDDTNGELRLNPNISLYDEEDQLDPNLECTVLSHLYSSPWWETIPCQEDASFVCDINLKELQVSCEDPGVIANGFSELQDPIRGLLRGAVLHFQCDKLHILKGEPTLHCLANGTWSASKPQCVRVPACLDPPSAKFGSFELLPPIAPQKNSRIAGPPASGARLSRVGVPLPPKQKRSVADDSPKELPPGHHRVGTRASYSCQSRYYELVGSQTRRCQADGTWTGRPVTCLPICGRSDSPRTPFITHGNSSDIGQWPWQVGVSQFLEEYKVHYLLCGGALISEQWVLTAAHCVTDANSHSILPVESFRLYAGKYHRDDKLDDNFVQMKKAVEIHVHPDYDSTVYDADIALIRLESYVTLTTRVQPVCLPTDKSTRLNIVDGRKGVVTGWGLTESSEYAESLRQAVLPVVSHEKCEAGYERAGMPLTVTENMFCAGLAAGMSDACSGDSGGPMVFQDDTGSRKFWVLEGIVSWGSPTGCGNANQYGGFTKVHRFLDWINQFV